MPKVSIVMPVYNGEKYLKESVESILTQSYTDWELIFVNDCSIDKTLEIMRYYQARDKRIKIIDNKRNLKLPISLNIGFKCAKGDYFTWTSDDNIYDRDAIRSMVYFLEQRSQFGMVYCDMYFIDEIGTIIGSISSDINNLYYNNCIGACFLYRKEVAETTGEYNPKMFLVEDYDYWLRISERYIICHLKKILYKYRIHDNSLTEKKFLQVSENLFRLRINKLDYILSAINISQKKDLFLSMYEQYPEQFQYLKKKFWNNGNMPEELKWIERKRIMKITKKIVLFGAGKYGYRALKYFGKENVAYFIDNRTDLSGTIIYGKKVISLNDFKNKYDDYQIIISTSAKTALQIAKQLEENGITDFSTYIEYVNKNKKSNIKLCNRVYNAISWIRKNTIRDKGVIVHNNYKQVYPEVTGYYIPTLLKWGYKEEAIVYAKWLCTIQGENGEWYDAEEKNPYIFDSAQILKGLLAIRELMPEVDYNIIKGCDWLISNIQEDGRLVTPSIEEWGDKNFCPELIHLYCLSPLIEASKIYKQDKYKISADRVSKYYINNAKDDILNYNCFSHFYAYVLEGLCDIGEKKLAGEAMEKIASLQKSDGMIPALKDVNWVCSTAMFQFAVVWYKLGELKRGNKAFNYAIQLQNETGGWFGSYTVADNINIGEKKEYPTYFVDCEISWAVKFFLDALYYKLKEEFRIQADMFPDTIEKNDGRYQLILKYARNAKNILDAGCGKGRYIKNLKEDLSSEVRIHAVDLSDKIMDNLDVESRVCSLTNIPYENNKFDLVYACESLEHSVISDNAIKELVRITTIGGYIIIIDKKETADTVFIMEEWEQYFSNNYMKRIAENLNCKIDIIENVSYENNESESVFSGWILCREK